MAEIAVERHENYDAPAGLGSLQTLALGAGVIGLIILALSPLFGSSIQSALRAYLIGFCYWAGISIGCLGLLLLQHLTGGSWGLVIRRALEAAAKVLPLVGLLFIPLVIGATQMYEWAHYEAEGHIGSKLDEVLDWKAPYLNIFWWTFRAILYFVLLSGFAYTLSNWSKKQDETGDWKISNSMNMFSAPAFIAFFLIVTFASVDWVMSLDPHWFSTMFGLMFAIGWALSAMAFVIALMAWMVGRAPMNHVLTSAHFHDLGKIMLAMVMVWAYFNFSQFLIIYAANIPEETPWYLKRMQGGWGIIGLVLILFHFAFPFLLLLSQDLKKRANNLAAIAVFVLIMRLVDLFYLIAPNPVVGAPHGEDHGGIEIASVLWSLVAWIGIGGIWLFAFIYLFKQRPVMPVNDPFFENALAHGREHH